MLKSSDITIITLDIPPENQIKKRSIYLPRFILSSDYFNNFVEYSLTESSTPALSVDDFIKRLKDKFYKE